MKKKRNMNTSDIISRFIAKHGNRYDYSLVEYKSYYEKVKIKCNDHGYFYQTAHHHYDGRGCPKCPRFGAKKNQNDVLMDFKNIHGDEFLYEKFIYVNDYSMVTVTCRIHGDFNLTPNSHKNGTKCPICFLERSGFGKNRFIKCSERFGGVASLYVIKCSGNEEEFYKVGITTDFMKRFKRSVIPYDYKIIKLIDGDSSLIWEIEKKVHRDLFKYRYKPKNKFSGSSECFNISSIDEALKILDLKVATNEEIKAGRRL